MDTVGKVITCKACVSWEANKPTVIETIEVDPPQKGEVRVKIVASGVCHSDLSAQNGSILANFPTILGHEGAGIVESIGEGVTSVKPGDHVLTTFVPQCRNCNVCKNYPDRNLCKVVPDLTLSGLMADGTKRLRCNGKPLYNFIGVSSFAEYSVLSELNTCKVSKEAPLESLCLLSCGVSTGYGAAVKTAKVSIVASENDAFLKVHEGATCAVWGLGGIGLATVMGCRNAGAKRIFCIDLNPAKADVAKQFGMTDFLNPKDNEKSIPEILVEMTEGGVDYAFDCVGHKALVEDAFASCHPAYGTCVVVGVPPHTHRVAFDPIEIMFGRQIIGSWFGGWKPLDEVPKLADAYMKKELMLDEFITKKLPMEKLNEAYQLMIDGKVIRTVLTMN